MRITQVTARVFGEKETREYEFMVDTSSTYLALPLEEIEALGLRRTRGTVKLMSATGMVDVATYFAEGELMGQEFGAIAVPALTPLLGYQLLQNMRLKVNPVRHQIEKVPDDEIHPPYQLAGNTKSDKLKPVAQVKMVKCIREEPQPPCNIDELEDWCNSGYSARPVQQHVGDTGIILWRNSDGMICVQFDDGDERLLFPEEVEFLPK